ncbi:hypothetical protein WZ342_2614 [Enterococcus faecalis]|nr:hypothetical protein WZ342_2614 [Enterococcus faecalis]
MAAMSGCSFLKSSFSSFFTVLCASFISFLNVLSVNITSDFGLV